jgi:hypothetical protein
LTKEELRQAAQVQRRAGTPIGEAINGVLSRRPRVETIEVFIGAVREALRATVEHWPQGRRDDVLRAALESLVPADAAVRLTPTHYTITTSSPLPDEIAAGLDDVVAERLSRYADA